MIPKSYRMITGRNTLSPETVDATWDVQVLDRFYPRLLKWMVANDVSFAHVRVKTPTSFNTENYIRTLDSELVQFYYNLLDKRYEFVRVYDGRTGAVTPFKRINPTATMLDLAGISVDEHVYRPKTTYSVKPKSKGRASGGNESTLGGVR